MRRQSPRDGLCEAQRAGLNLCVRKQDVMDCVGGIKDNQRGGKKMSGLLVFIGFINILFNNDGHE